VSNAGGPGILAADACAGAGLEVQEFSEPTQAALRAFTAADASVRNPIDLVAGATAAHFERAMRVVIDDPTVDAVLVIFTPPLVTRAEDVANAIATVARDAGDTTLVACFLGRNGVPDELRGEGAPRTVPSFAFPEAAARALSHAADLADWRRQPVGSVPELERIDVERARRVVDRALGDGTKGVWLDAPSAIELLDSFGIPVVRSRVAVNADGAEAAAAELGYPVALKAAAPNLVHKTDVGGVTLNLTDGAAVRRAFDAMHARLGDSMGGGLVQAMSEPGIETIVGCTHDPLFGPLVLFGLGGVTAELLGDRALRIVPLTDTDAQELVRSLRGSPLFFGYRGRPAVDVPALEDLLLRVGRLADELPEVAEMDLNPVIVGERGVIAVDVKIHVAPADAPLPPDFRRMRV
jgi:acyl-CoA synthetase (NDP forming)